MPKTTKLNLNLTTDTSTPVSTWQKSLDGDNDGVIIEKSNMQLIDEFANSVDTRVVTLETTLNGVETLLAGI